MKELLTHLQWLDDQQDDMMSSIVELCNLNSHTLNLSGLGLVKDKLIELFEPLGGDLEVIESDPLITIDDQGQAISQPLGEIIHIQKRPDASKKIMLCIHMDTVYSKDDEFQVCSMTEGGQLNGPGVADAKGGLMVMLYALKTLELSPLAENVGWEVIINSDEELGSPGSEKFIRARAPHCDFGLLFEPALPGGHLVSWRKGSGDFTFIVRGKSAHSGRDFTQGRNAIVALARLLDEIDRLNGEPDVTFNVGRISGGGALNRVPDLAVGRVNVRVKDLEEQNGVEIDFEDLVKKYNQFDGITVEMHGRFTSPPKPADEDAATIQNRIIQCADSLGMVLQFKGTGGACDGNKFADAGLPNVDSMGPCGGHIHSSNEFLIPESLVPRTKLTALTLLTLAAEVSSSSADS